MQFKRQAYVVLLAFASAFAVSACSTMEEQTTQATSAASGTSASATGDPLATPPAPKINGYTFEAPKYDMFEQNQYGFHQFDHRGARCVRVSESGTCVWWLG